MAILVTGGAGYIGSVTVEYLVSRGEQVVVLDNLSRGHREAVPLQVPFYKGNMGDRELVTQITREYSVESCIHLAAYAYVGESVAEPRLYFENNVGQGTALFGSLLQAGVRRIVFSSSCVTYGEPLALPIRESEKQWPTSPYGWSKLLLERELAAYDRAYGMKFVCLRYFNAAGATEKCGERHTPETHLIPNVLLAASGRKSEVSVYGDDYETADHTAIRDYIHVGDLAEAHGLALDYLRKGGASEFLNLGSGCGHSVLEVIEYARQITGRPIPIRIEPPRPGDPARLVADATRAREILGWTAKQSDLSTIIHSAWSWHQEHP